MTLIHDARAFLERVFWPFHAGEGKLATQILSVPEALQMSVFSESFKEGERIPRRYAGEGENISPSISWTMIPASTRELVLICQDPDASTVNPYVHWICYRISPAINTIPENVTKSHNVTYPISLAQARNSQGAWGYTGPMPPAGNGPHRYHFQIFALDRSLRLGEEPRIADFVRAMSGHVIALGELVGTYERP